MKLIEFSVSNYRSITSAHKISLGNYTVLVGKNNEGKSNLLKALDVAMRAVLFRNMRYSFSSEDEFGYRYYRWVKDFPIQKQESGTRKLESIFKLSFLLNDDEVQELYSSFDSMSLFYDNATDNRLEIEIKIGRDNTPSVVIVHPQSKGDEARVISKFVSKKLTLNYIPAIRTDEMALQSLNDALEMQLLSLEDNPQYAAAMETIRQLTSETLDDLSVQIEKPLKTFIPNIKSVSIKQVGRTPRSTRILRNVIDIIIDDGATTSIRNKGDGIKSLATLAILEEQKKVDGASVIIIEEPESHLHPEAIHNLAEILSNLSKNNQVIISTHNPLFILQNNVSSNIIVNNGTARKASSIAEIRNILGVVPSDNLINATNVLVVEGETDYIALNKILPLLCPQIGDALQTNRLVIKPLHGVSNLAHELQVLKLDMCSVFVLVDNDEAGKKAVELANNKGLLSENNIIYANCAGQIESEFEDCINPTIYKKAFLDLFNVDVSTCKFKVNSKKKWSERISLFFSSQGKLWNDKICTEAKMAVSECIKNSQLPINEIIEVRKEAFFDGLIRGIEKMISFHEN